MCGICGAVWSSSGQGVDEATLRHMTRILAHRGPDDEQFLWKPPMDRTGRSGIPGVGLGFRRLAIIDLATGRQPISNEDETVWAVFNGEIYNYRELRHRLEGHGHTFRTRGDAEVIVHLYEDLGVQFLEHLVGMFAIAVWDQRQGSLMLARDRLGQKPLVYSEQPGRLLFASELKSLLQVPGLGRDLDPGAVDAYFAYQYVPHPRTIFRGIRKLPPAHYAEYREGTLQVKPYWSPDFNVESTEKPETLRNELRERLTTSVKLRLQSDVPLGAFLSGGVDSALIVGLMQKLRDDPVRTFSIGFTIPEYDESAAASSVARRLGTDHTEFRLEPERVDIWEKLVWQFDEPFADSSAIPTWYVSQLAREEVTVSLTGDGGDELFAGYPRYRAVRLSAWADQYLPGSVLAAARRCAAWLPTSLRQKSRRRRLKRFLEAIVLPEERRYLEWIYIFNDARRAELYTDDFLSSLTDTDPAVFCSETWNRAGQRDPVTRAATADLLTYLPCDLMTKVDMASMAHGLECRQPFLDHRVVEWASRIPLRFKMRGLSGKRILAQVFPDLLPASVMRRPKMGFGVPLGHWFRHELKGLLQDSLSPESLARRGIMRPEIVRRYVNEHLAGDFDHGYRLWALLVFEMWCRTWLDAVPTRET